jgi:hypothetical protein
MNEKMNETMTLDDLIRRGVEIREKRIAEERARIAAFYEKLAREHTEEERAIRALLPPPLDKLSKVDVVVRHAYIYITEFPGRGKVRIYASKKDGQWNFLEYEAYNPDGYYLKFQTLEEAVAYAAGALEI